jgi:hypothetical protein
MAASCHVCDLQGRIHRTMRDVCATHRPLQCFTESVSTYVAVLLVPVVTTLVAVVASIVAARRDHDELPLALIKDPQQDLAFGFRCQAAEVRNLIHRLAIDALNDDSGLQPLLSGRSVGIALTDHHTLHARWRTELLSDIRREVLH